MSMFQKRVNLDTSHILKAVNSVTKEMNDGDADDADDAAASGGSSFFGTVGLVGVGFAISSAIHWFRARSAQATHAYKLP